MRSAERSRITSEPGVTPFDRTRAIIGSELGFPIEQRTGDAYRDPTGAQLEGDWLGAFAHPSVVLDTVTVVSMPGSAPLRIERELWKRELG